MKLAIFDVDGTLTRTNAVDNRCFLRALHEVVGVEANPDWSTYADVTDSGIVSDLFFGTHGKRPRASDLRTFVTRFVALLVEAQHAEPDEFREVRGAAAFLEGLRAAGWCFAIATGGFGASARRKLAFAAIDATRAPLACADDSRSRERIVMLARKRALLHVAASSFERVVVVGDAPWDRRAAATLRLPFVRVGTPTASDRDTPALADFLDRAAALRALENATVPELAVRTSSAGW